MIDPITIPSGVVAPTFNLVTTGVATGWRWASRFFFSPTILIAGQQNAGKTTLRNYFVTGDFPDTEELTDETQEFESRLVDLTFQRENGPQRTISLWIKDGRGFADSDPLVKDVAQTHPVFIYFVFDVRRIVDSDAIDTPTRYEFVHRWVQRFRSRVEEHVVQNSEAKRKLCGAAVLVNKCDLVDEDELRRKKDIFARLVMPHFEGIQPRLGFGEQIKVCYTSMIRGKASELPLAIDFMFRQMIIKGAA
jgi:hypothetical protein